MKKRLVPIFLALLMLSGCNKTVVAHTLRDDIEYVPPETETSAVTSVTTAAKETADSETEVTEISDVTTTTVSADETTVSSDVETEEEDTDETTATATEEATATVSSSNTTTTAAVIVTAVTTTTTKAAETAATTTTSAAATTTTAVTTTKVTTTAATTKVTTTTAATTTTSATTTTTAAATTARTTTTTLDTEICEEEEYEEEEEPEYDYNPLEAATEVLKHNATADSFIKSVNSFLTKAKSGGYGMINGEEGSIIYFYVEDGLWMVSVDNTDCFNYKEEVMEWGGYGEADKNTSTASAEDPDTLLAIHMAKEFPAIYNASAGVWVEDGKCKAAYFTDDTTSGDSQIEYMFGVGGWTDG